MQNDTPSFLVVDGYTKAARDELQAGGASLAADLYVGMLRKNTPSGADANAPKSP